MYGSIKRIERVNKTCAYCGVEFSPRHTQIRTNKSGLFFCSKQHLGFYKRDHAKDYSYAYKKHIIDRDGGACMICGKTENLSIHHIRTRGSGGDDEYHNLVTLCWGGDGCHIAKAHGMEAAKYKKIFEKYVSVFPRPDFWDAIMEQSKRDHEKIKSNMRAIAKKSYQKMKNTPAHKEYMEQQKKRRNERNKEYKKKHGSNYTTYIQRFKKEHDGLSPTQVQYRKQKEWKRKNPIDNY